MRGVEIRGLRPGEGVGEAITEPLRRLKSCKSSAFQRGVGQVWALDCHAQKGRLTVCGNVFVIYIGIPLRIWLYCYTYAGQDICKGSHRLVRDGVGAWWVALPID